MPHGATLVTFRPGETAAGADTGTGGARAVLIA